MGSYSQLTIADYPVFSLKNDFYHEILRLIFLPNDFIKEPRKYASRNKLVWGDAYENEKGTFRFKGYRQTVKVCKQRLEIYGMSLQKIKKVFPSIKKIALKENFYEFALSKVSFKQYLEEIKDILDKKEINYDQLYTNLRDSLITDELGIPGQTLSSHLYSILCCVPDDAIVEYDLTDVINGGWVTENIAKQIAIEKIILLTEGKTDVEFIRAALKKKYPTLYPYYHFIDFEEYKLESNASALVKLVTSLAASNINHPIIVLFDNDTTGIMEMNKLNSVRIGHNIKVIKLPDILLAKNYPTIGPTGEKKMNINGYACGIEMYLGKDILKSNGNYIPVQWKGYNEKENKYQGEISDKQKVHDVFRNKIRLNTHFDMTELEMVLQLIFKAYQK